MFKNVNFLYSHKASTVPFPTIIIVGYDNPSPTLPLKGGHKANSWCSEL